MLSFLDYIDELAFSQALAVADSDSTHPRVVWGEFPGARFGLDNPDTIYRAVPVDASSSYLISGTRNNSLPGQFSVARREFR